MTSAKIGAVLDPKGPWSPVVLAEHQDEYQTVHALKMDGAEGTVMMRLSLTDDERGLIAAGEDVYIEQLTFGHKFAPLRASVGLPEWSGLEGGLST